MPGQGADIFRLLCEKGIVTDELRPDHAAAVNERRQRHIGRLAWLDLHVLDRFLPIVAAHWEWQLVQAAEEEGIGVRVDGRQDDLEAVRVEFLMYLAQDLSVLLTVLSSSQDEREHQHFAGIVAQADLPAARQHDREVWRFPWNVCGRLRQAGPSGQGKQSERASQHKVYYCTGRSRAGYSFEVKP